MAIQIIYWTGSGNTEAMANAVAEGARAQGHEVVVKPVHEASIADVEGSNFIALGCPSMGAEVLEESEMEPFVESLSQVNWAGKKLALFGSYDWGDGEWMRNWEERMNDYGATLVADGYITRNAPEGEAIDGLKALGALLG